MPRSPTDRPAAVDAKIDAKTGRLICATIGLQLRRDFDVDEKPMPDRLALLLDEMQQVEAKN
jgi:hypothetical protein